MAISKSDIMVDGSFTRVYDITATADADTSLAIVHGLGATPNIAAVANVGTPAVAKAAGWTISALTSTTCTLTKATTAGSGYSTASCRVTISNAHSIIK